MSDVCLLEMKEEPCTLLDSGIVASETSST
jgi:hypothetical protein